MQRSASISRDPVATAKTRTTALSPESATSQLKHPVAPRGVDPEDLQTLDLGSRRSSYGFSTQYTPSIATTVLHARDPFSDIQPLLDVDTITGPRSSAGAVLVAQKLSQAEKAKALSILASSPETYCRPDHWKFNADKALLWAAIEGHAETIILLLIGWTPTSAKKTFQRPSFATHGNVIKASSVDVRSPERWTPLISAASRGHQKVAKILLDCGANIEAKTGIENLTPLHVAVKSGHTRLVQLLIDAGADIEARDETGKTVLLRIVQRGEPDLLDTLWNAGADSRATDYSGNTALHLAMSAIRDAPGHKIVVQLLLEHGLDVDARNKKGVRPLMCAASQAYEFGVTTLLEAGAGLHDKDNVGWTALCWAYSCRGYQWDTWESTFDIMRSKGAVCPHGKAFQDRL